MSWTDKQSIKVIKYLKDKCNIKTFVETGTYKGINAKLHSKHFKLVLTCENNNAFYEEAKSRIGTTNLGTHGNNVIVIKENSPEFLKKLQIGNYIFYLDAHFYDPKLPKSKRFVVLEELDNLRKFKNSIIIIHDFDNGLGHITYDGIDLDMNLIKDKLRKINNKFYFYTNTLEGCDIVKPAAQDIREAGLDVDYDTLDNLNYAWSTPRLTYRGILYCLPIELTDKELKELKLRKWKEK